MKTFLRLLHFLKPFLGLVALSVLLGVLTIAANIGLMASSAYLISAAALHPSIAELEVTIVGVRFFGISRGVFRYAERLVSHSVNFKLLSDLRVWFYRKLEPLAPARLMDIHSGDLLTRAVNDIETLENFYVRVVAPPITAAVVTLGMLVFLANYSLGSALTLVAFLLTVGVGLPMLAVILSRGPGRQLIQNRARLQTALIDGIQGLSDLLAYGQQENQVAFIRQINRENARIQTRLAVLNAANTALGVLLSNLGMLVVLILSIPLVDQGNLDGVLLAVLALAALASFEAVTPLPIAAQQLEVCLQAARRLFDLVDSEPAVRDPAHPLALPAFTDLHFHNVSFRYTQNLPLALDQISFDLPGGKHLAIVGPSGAGKSTLVKLLLRFWEPDSGQIYLGNSDIRNLRQEDIRKQFAVISQSAYLFDASLRQNLLLAQPKASEFDLLTALQSAQLDGWVKSLPNGLDTWIGEHGMRISGGERQRLAIARALLMDAPIYLLDEPAANLDPITEAQLWETLKPLLANRTLLLITHRLINLEQMDEIIVLDRGQIVERGCHSDLMTAGGLYRTLLELQRHTIEETDHIFSRNFSPETAS